MRGAGTAPEFSRYADRARAFHPAGRSAAPSETPILPGEPAGSGWVSVDSVKGDTGDVMRDSWNERARSGWNPLDRGADLAERWRSPLGDQHRPLPPHVWLLARWAEVRRVLAAAPPRRVAFFAGALSGLVVGAGLCALVTLAALGA